MIRLKGITWDHPRGYAPLRACAQWEHVVVDWEVRSLKDFGDASLAQLAAQYDLLILDHPHCGEAAQGALLPMDAYLDDATLAEVAAGEPSVSYRAYHFQDRQWALPIDAACQVGCYRPDLIEAAALPQTWEAFIEQARAWQQQGRWAVMALCPTDTLCSFLTLCAQHGDAPEGASWISPTTVTNVIEQLKAIRDVCHPDSLTMNPIAVYERMAQEDSLVYCPLAFGYTDYMRPTAPGYRLQFTGIPGVKGALLGGAGIGVSAKTAHPHDAMRYAAYLCSGAVQAGAYAAHHEQPAHPAAFVSLQANAQTGQFLAQTASTLQHAYTRPRLPGWPAFQEWLGDLLHDCLLEKIDTPSAVAAIAAQHRTLLSPACAASVSF